MALLIASCTPAEIARPPAADLIIRDVTIVRPKDGTLLPHRDIAVRDGRISEVTPTSGSQAKLVIDGRGRFAIPALIDMHVHIENEAMVNAFLRGAACVMPGTYRADDLLLPFVANGVLTVVDMAATADHLAWRSRTRSGEILGPRILSAAMIDGRPPIQPSVMSRSVSGPAEAREAVRAARAAGYDMIKVYSGLSKASFDAIVDEAGQAGLPVVGHIPLRGEGRTAELVRPGFALVVHAEEYLYQAAAPTDAAIDAFADLAHQAGTALSPTLVLYRRLLEQAQDMTTITADPSLRFVHPATRLFWLPPNNPYKRLAKPETIARMRTGYAFQRRLTQRFAERGIEILAGTDSMVPGVAPGAALHEELAELVEAGLTPAQALVAATSRPARFLGLANEIGTIDTGKSAEILLIDGNPLADVRNTRRIAGVVNRTRWLPVDEINARMHALADRYDALQSTASWACPAAR